MQIKTVTKIKFQGNINEKANKNKTKTKKKNFTNVLIKIIITLIKVLFFNQCVVCKSNNKKIQHVMQ